MTKEKLITNIMSYLGYCDGATLDRINENFDEFFSQNICIPKGNNRHPDADVFHEAMEDLSKTIQFEDGHNGKDWTDLHIAIDRKHRIKPQAPWSCATCITNNVCDIYRTLDEVHTHVLVCPDYEPKDSK
jgi:hypothetical protein